MKELIEKINELQEASDFDKLKKVLLKKLDALKKAQEEVEKAHDELAKVAEQTLSDQGGPLSGEDLFFGFMRVDEYKKRS